MIGDYELQFTSQAPFNFSGGGLIIRFSSPGGAFASDLQQDQTLINDANGTDSSGFFVKRFFNDADGLPPYGDSDTQGIGGFRLTLLDVPPTPPSGPSTTLPKKKCKKHKKRSAAAAKKCKKKRR